MSNYYYNRNAKQLFDQYQSMDSDKVRASWLEHLTSKTGLSLGVGGGSGCDAVWLAQLGWEVIVVEQRRSFMKTAAFSMIRYHSAAGNAHLVKVVRDLLVPV